MTRIHPTKAKLITTFLELAAQKGVESVTVEDVLAASKVSKGSLYHHFANFDDLIEEAMAQLYAEGIDRSITVMSSTLLGCKTREEFLAGIKLSIEQTISPESKPFRLNRARIIGMCSRNAALQARIAGEQERLSTAFQNLIREAQQQGWVRPELDVAAGALLIQAYTFGKVIDDIAINPVNQQAWANLLMQLLESVYLNQAPSE